MKRSGLLTGLAALVLSAALLAIGCSKQPVTQAAAGNQPSPAAGNANARLITSTGGNFSVLTYNIAGLPQALSSAPAPRDSSSAQIGRIINAYDIVHVQEDFNYHAYLYDDGNVHPYRSATSGGAGIGDGLNSLSYFPMTDYARITWNTRINENALTPKGFTYCRVRFAAGVYIDFYNLHTNAESDAASIAARADNLLQLSNFIIANSDGNAVVVMGDTNGRYTRDSALNLLLTKNGLTDPWISLIRHGSIPALGSAAIVCDFPDETDSCEIVDKIYYRGSKYIQLSASGYDVLHNFVNAQGQQLSDHLPLTVNFSYSLQAAFGMSDLFGGPHGTPFSDLSQLSASSAPAVITVSGGNRVDNVGLILKDGTVFTHGGTGGTAQSLTLQSGEYVNSVTLNSGQYNGDTRIFYISLSTNLGHSLSAGKTTSSAVTYTAPAGYKIAGFYGNSGDEVDKLGVIYNKQ